MTGYKLTVGQVLDIIYDETGISPDAIKGTSRKWWIVRHRHVATYLCKQFTGRSSAQIARTLCREQPSVLYAERAVRELGKQNSDWDRLLDGLIARIKKEANKRAQAGPPAQSTPTPKRAKATKMKRPSIKKPSNDEPKDGPRQQQKRRTCLNAECGREFLSLHFGNRFCPTCTKRRNMTSSADPRFEGVAR